MVHCPILLRRAILSALLGAATSLAIAWTIARRTTSVSMIAWFAETVRDPHPHARSMGHPILFPEIVVCEARGLIWIRLDPYSGTSSRAAAFSAPRPAMEADLRTIPAWAEPIITSSALASRPIAILAAGWPLPVVRTFYRSDPNTGNLEPEPIACKFTSRTNTATCVIDSYSPFTESVPRIIPLIPLWTNLALSTALYGSAWACALTAFVAIRARARRRRNHCPNCNYDLSATPMPHPCPECGQPRPIR